jgi:hypothetical protein
MPRTTLSDKIERTAEGRFEVFKPVVTLSPRQKESFRKDPGRFLTRLFEKQGHKVNQFYVSTTFERKVGRLLDKTPPDSDAQFVPVVVHVVDGGGMVSRYM